jgi:sugar phosphate isomerase/epimerase
LLKGLTETVFKLRVPAVRVLVFTKPFGAIGAAELAGHLAELGADGAELVVREGQTVSPADPRGIGAVARELEHHGLRLGVVTTDLADGDGTAERIIAACAEAGVPLVRAGFYRYDAAMGYHRCLDAARRGLAALAGLAAGHGVRLAVQLHHGTIHASAAQAHALTGDLDSVLFYADPGNQAKEGSEDWRLGLDILGDRLACMGVKNAAWRRGPGGWAPEWVPLADGVVAWPDIVPGLRARGYGGPLSLHVHYPAPDLLAALRTDLTELRRLLDSNRAHRG